VKQSLLRLRKTAPAIFRNFFHRFTPLILLDRNRIRQLLREVGSGTARKVFRDYVQYASRFKMRMRRTARTFHPRPFDPPEGKFRARIEGGRLASKKRIFHPMYENLFLDEDIAVVPELETLIKQGEAKVFRLNDSKGTSSLNEIEYLAYQPSGVTFIIHHAQRPFI
jgi:hypothetical protein